MQKLTESQCSDASPNENWRGNGYLFHTPTRLTHLSVQTCNSIRRTDSLLHVSISRLVQEDQGINEKKKNKGISDNMIFYSFFKWQLNPQGLKEQSLSYHSKFLYPSLSFPVQQYFYLSQKHGLNFGWSHMEPGIGPGDAGGSLLTGCSVILCSVFSITCRSCPQTGSHRGCRNVYPCAWCWMRFTRNQ